MTADNSNRRMLRIILYAVLATSAAGAFLGGGMLWAAARAGDLPLWVPLLAPIAFTLFVVLYAVDRWLLVRRDGYPVARALFQVAFTGLFLSILWPQQLALLHQARADGHTDAAVRLLASPNAEVRALMCELLALRRQNEARGAIDDLASNDTNENVRDACAKASVALRGK